MALGVSELNKKTSTDLLENKQLWDTHDLFRHVMLYNCYTVHDICERLPSYHLEGTKVNCFCRKWPQHTAKKAVEFSEKNSLKMIANQHFRIMRVFSTPPVMNPKMQGFSLAFVHSWHFLTSQESWCKATKAVPVRNIVWFKHREAVISLQLHLILKISATFWTCPYFPNGSWCFVRNFRWTRS